MRVCPQCERPLVALEYHGVEVDWCLDCKGLWLDQGELGLLMAGDPAAEVRLALRSGARSKRRCARCGDHLREARIAAADVTVDQCPHGHGLWFDAGEVQAIINSVGDQAEIAKLSDFCESLFGASFTQGERI